MPEDFNILTVSRYMKFYDSIVPLISKHCAGNGIFSSDVTEAKKILLTNSIDAIIINAPLTDGFGIDFALECITKKNIAVLMFLPKELYEPATHKVSSSGILTLQKPTTNETVIQSLILLKSTAMKLKKFTVLSSENSDVRELKILTTAKMLLISSLGMSEEQAHKYIERRSMEARKTKLCIAESIIKSYGH